jgi:hypothetical protein
MFSVPKQNIVAAGVESETGIGASQKNLRCARHGSSSQLRSQIVVSSECTNSRKVVEKGKSVNCYIGSITSVPGS